MTVACSVCGGSTATSMWGEDLVRCTTCSLVRAADRYFDIDPARVYDAQYFTGAEYVDYRGDRSAVRRNSARRLAILREMAPRARTLFEIGCGFGYFLELASRHWSVSGIEVSAHAASEAQGLNLTCVHGEYLALPPPSAPVDIVCLWDTIEHLVAPEKVVRKIAAEMAPGAILAISTGDIERWLPRLQQRRWRQIHPPTHLWYFSAETLAALVRNAGFRILRIIYPPFYRSLRLYLRAFAGVLPRRIGDWPIPFQTWDLMELYAQRLDNGVTETCAG